jgi:hypothetical protein
VLAFFSVAPLLVAAVPPSDSPSLAGLLDAGWQVQRRWTAVSANGSFVYEFSLQAWNGAGKLKESFTRTARVFNRGEEHRTEVLAATKDGKDVTAEARADEEKQGGRPRPKPKAKDDFPSPFDPRFRDRYDFSQQVSPGGETELAFRPRGDFDGALEGNASYDATGAPRRVEFRLAKRPRFTKRLDFTIMIGENGYPERVESNGEISLVVWKRKFESTLILRDVRAGSQEAP